MSWFGRKKKDFQEYAEDVVINDSLSERNTVVRKVFEKPKYSAKSRQKE